MATLQTNPSSTPATTVEWTRELNVSEISRVGDINIVLDEWNETSSALPDILEGSFIEISNSMYVEASNIAIVTSGQTVSDINWVIYSVSGSTATASLTNVDPTVSMYNAEKAGFYNGSGHRYTGHYMAVDSGGTLYTNKGFLDYANGAMLKYRIDDEAGDFVIDADVEIIGDITAVDGTFSGDVSVGDDLSVTDDLLVGGAILPTLSSTGSWSVTSTPIILSRGIYNVARLDGTSPNFAKIQVWISNLWRDIATGDNASSLGVNGTVVLSDGTNVRILSSAGSLTVYYQKY